MKEDRRIRELVLAARDMMNALTESRANCRDEARSLELKLESAADRIAGLATSQAGDEYASDLLRALAEEFAPRISVPSKSGLPSMAQKHIVRLMEVNAERDLGHECLNGGDRSQVLLTLADILRNQTQCSAQPFEDRVADCERRLREALRAVDDIE